MNQGTHGNSLTHRMMLAFAFFVTWWSLSPRPLMAQSGAGTLTSEQSVDPRVDEILTQLENARNGMKDIRCRVRFVEEDKINLVTRLKLGQITFLMTDPNPLFAIHFSKTEMDGVLGKQEWYLFDGRWLHEANERIQQVTKREIAKPGQRLDLFDLENAPFPVPFGHKKEVILRNFNVTLAPPTPADPADTDHLLCIPKPTSPMREKYDQLDLHVLRNIHLPARIVAIKNDRQEINTADFVELSPKSINTGLSQSDFAPSSEWKGYAEVVED